MSALRLVILFFSVAAYASALPTNATLDDSCTINTFNDVSSVTSSCTSITLKGITIPAGETLDLSLKSGTTVKITGTIKFDYKTWDGPLMRIKGSKVTVKADSGVQLNGQGEKYWDGQGDKGKTKPKFLKIQTTGGSVIQDLYLLNCPRQCVSINDVDSTTIKGFTIDVSAGDTDDLGHNTDGFDISKATNLVIQDSTIKNQDDCVAINYGSNIKISGLKCSGGHGLSLSVGQSKDDSSTNQVKNVTFSDCEVKKSRNGIHIKTHTDAAAGYIKDVTYKNIKLSDITHYGINVQEDYKDGSSTGSAKGNIPITKLNMNSITGSMTGSSGMDVYILCGSGGCSDWTWSGVSISGNKKSDSCNFSPSGYTCK
ncbi:polygalacturonase-like [Cylas formicarius]|uniref:polygalacturonase-like n=1 Tax=Cylas formicarius TaxID=197179 RepID=UPI0029587D68|nr:polygalacturonase-like [Cylas formicarius]